MDDYLPACLEHMHADVMPRSGRCRECIAEANKDARPYLEAAHNLAEGCREVNKYLRQMKYSLDAIDH